VGKEQGNDSSGTLDARAVGQYMTATPASIAHDASLADAHQLMSQHACRHLPVLRDGAIVGVLSDRDVAVVESLGRTPSAQIRVVEAMTPVPYAVPKDMPLGRVVRQMQRNKYGCTLVTNGAGGSPVGIFTTTDALRALHELLTDE
jgi:acetoin utilization protein AcuB